MEYYETKGS